MSVEYLECKYCMKSLFLGSFTVIVQYVVFIRWLLRSSVSSSLSLSDAVVSGVSFIVVSDSLSFERSLFDARFDIL